MAYQYVLLVWLADDVVSTVGHNICKWTQKTGVYAPEKVRSNPRESSLAQGTPWKGCGLCKALRKALEDPA
ncbi:uncharacterized protein C8Q71DRAFT_276949 [Rhodofomes roseus]|uniref:Uncharacterized protein n=1 Tax=Rhodofomes roseus TaxID=34475 RepID=A0ABQ8K4X0_9APHY|nr:uncharacterized protein C8Q71DRAFT_276949 [Rhodofomes roseus]KAH9832007.1 hypothetical protein C8Q71DRAFT_276949 [Rhodofomes roseus]